MTTTKNNKGCKASGCNCNKAKEDDKFFDGLGKWLEMILASAIPPRMPSPPVVSRPKLIVLVPKRRKGIIRRLLNWLW